VEYPVIYILEEEGGEANGTVLYFCSEDCRALAIRERGVESDPPHVLGVSVDWPCGTICNECLTPLKGGV